MTEKKSLLEAEKKLPKPFSDKDIDAAYAHVRAYVKRSVDSTRRFKRDYIGTGPDVEKALNAYKASNEAQKHLKVLLHKTMHGSHKQFVKDMENMFRVEAREKRFSSKKSLLNEDK